MFRSRLPNRSQRRATKTGRPSVQRNDIGKITLQEGEALKATAAQLHELKIDGAGTVYLSELTGNPELVGLKPTGGVFADAEGADVGTLVYVLGLARVTDISNMNQEVVIDAYSVSGKTISGTGKVIITGLESPEDSDFAAITPQGGVTINAASA